MRGQMPGMQPAPQPQMPANPFEAILKGMFGQAGQPQPSPQASPSDPFGGALGQILGGMFGGMAPQPEPAPPPAPRSTPRRAPAPEPEPEEAAPSSSANGPGSIGLDALNQMFEHGRQIQDDHQNALKSILDAMLGGGQARR